MAEDMVLFFEGFLTSLATFLSSPPIIYIVGGLVLIPFMKAIKAFIR